MASKTPPSEALAAWLAGRRWFATKTRRITAVATADRIPVGPADVFLVDVTLDDGRRDRYAVPLVWPAPGAPDAIVDAFDEPAFCRALLDLVARGARARGDRGEIRGRATRAFPPGDVADPVRRVGGEQSNTSVVFGDRLILKAFRRVADGVNPEQEIAEFLTERTHYANTPPLSGVLEYHGAGGAGTLAVAQRLVAGARDGWEWMVDRLREVYARSPDGGQPAATITARAGETLAAAARLGERTAGLHLALASRADDPAFAPEPITGADVAAWTDAVRDQVAAARRLLGPDAPAVGTADVADALGGLAGRTKIRHHGDFHLGQTLTRAGDFFIIDFEGEPARPLAERRRKHAAVRDVAGLLRSLHYAAVAAMPPGGEARAEAWESVAAAAFVDGYRRAAGAAPFLPESVAAFRRAVAAFEVEKAAYEVVYEANNRPDWIHVPRLGLTRAAARLARVRTETGAA